MRRRRRPIRRRLSPMPAGPDRRVKRMLSQAHRMLESGEHQRAADIFERLARGAEERGFLKPAPNLYLQAGRANLLAGNQDKAMSYLKHGLALLANAERWPALHTIGNRVVVTLREAGQDESAQEISDWLKTTLANHPVELLIPQIEKELPGKCEYCGATVRADEVEWIDANSVECIYCGSSLNVKE